MVAQSASYYPSGHDPGKPDARDPHVRFDMSDRGPGTIGTSSDPTYPWAFERELKGSNALVFSNSGVGGNGEVVSRRSIRRSPCSLVPKSNTYLQIVENRWKQNGG